MSRSVKSDIGSRTLAVLAPGHVSRSPCENDEPPEVLSREWGVAVVARDVRPAWKGHEDIT